MLISKALPAFFKISLWDRQYCYFHFTDEEAEPQGSWERESNVNWVCFKYLANPFLSNYFLLASSNLFNSFIQQALFKQET